MDKKLQNELNTAYKRLEVKQTEILRVLVDSAFELESGWYNGHYHRDESGGWAREAYPIPVIGVRGICDIEIEFDKISVSTKLERNTALEYSFEKLGGYEFEAYGVDDYLADFYHNGQTVEELKNNIRSCDETEIGFSFDFSLDTDGRQIFELAEMLRCEGFYY